MLINIDPRITPELLFRLARMGHGDEIAVVDANYPAYSAGVEVIHLPGVSVPDAVGLLLELIPLDSFVEHPIRAMVPTDGAESTPRVHQDVTNVLTALRIPATTMVALERFAFYEAARSCSAVIATSDPVAYGCFMVKKGVL